MSLKAGDIVYWNIDAMYPRYVENTKCDWSARVPKGVFDLANCAPASRGDPAEFLFESKLIDMHFIPSNVKVFKTSKGDIVMINLSHDCLAYRLKPLKVKK